MNSFGGRSERGARRIFERDVFRREVKGLETGECT